jgi:hypothetical protein
MMPMALNEHVVKSLGEKCIEKFDEFPLTWFRPICNINIGHENFRGAWERDNKGIDLPVAVHPTYIHPRMAAQRSVFTIHGLMKDPLDSLVPSTILAKINICPASYKTILTDLSMLGIQEASAYPDLDGLARELSFMY